MRSGATAAVNLRALGRGSVSYDTERPSTAQSRAFERMCAYFARELFDEKLPATILTFDRSVALPSTFHPDRWSPRMGGPRVSEISLNPDLFRDLTKKKLAMTLCHELVHLWQHVHGRMRSRESYHNVEWSEKLLSIGLVPSDTGRPGGKPVGQRMTQYAVPDGAFEKALARMPKTLALPFLGREARRTKTTDRSKSKFVCLRCGDQAWGKPTLALDCRKCLASFVLEEGGGSGQFSSDGLDDDHGSRDVVGDAALGPVA